MKHHGACANQLAGKLQSFMKLHLATTINDNDAWWNVSYLSLVRGEDLHRRRMFRRGTCAKYSLPVREQKLRADLFAWPVTSRMLPLIVEFVGRGWRWCSGLRVDRIYSVKETLITLQSWFQAKLRNTSARVFMAELLLMSTLCSKLDWIQVKYEIIIVTLNNFGWIRKIRNLIFYPGKTFPKRPYIQHKNNYMFLKHTHHLFYNILGVLLWLKWPFQTQHFDRLSFWGNLVTLLLKG